MAKLFNSQDLLDGFTTSCGFNPAFRLYNLTTFISVTGITASGLTTSLANSTCRPGSISRRYGTEKVNTAITTLECDLIILAEQPTVPLKSNIKRIGLVHGFLISQKGECVKFPEVHSVSLICTKNGCIPNAGSLLLGAYLYVIKSTPSIPQMGILDLAFGHSNTGGYCAYKKFGFDYRAGLFNDCYPPEDGGYDNLPMAVDISPWQPEYIIQLTTGAVKLPKGPLCDLRGDQQLTQSFIDKMIFLLNEGVTPDNIRLSLTIPEYISAFDIISVPINKAYNEHTPLTSLIDTATASALLLKLKETVPVDTPPPPIPDIVPLILPTTRRPTKEDKKEIAAETKEITQKNKRSAALAVTRGTTQGSLGGKKMGSRKRKHKKTMRTKKHKRHVSKKRY
jgi:hypothetical protein